MGGSIKLYAEGGWSRKEKALHRVAKDSNLKQIDLSGVKPLSNNDPKTIHVRTPWSIEVLGRQDADSGQISNSSSNGVRLCSNYKGKGTDCDGLNGGTPLGFEVTALPLGGNTSFLQLPDDNNSSHPTPLLYRVVMPDSTGRPCPSDLYCDYMKAIEIDIAPQGNGGKVIYKYTCPLSDCEILIGE